MSNGGMITKSTLILYLTGMQTWLIKNEKQAYLQLHFSY